MSRKVRPQVAFKRLYGKCLLCPEARYEALECHRVVPGCDGGVYRDGNVVVLCGNCHALATAGRVEIKCLRRTSAGRQVALVRDEAGVEDWVPLIVRGEAEDVPVRAE